MARSHRRVEQAKREPRVTCQEQDLWTNINAEVEFELRLDIEADDTKRTGGATSAEIEPGIGDGELWLRLFM